MDENECEEMDQLRAQEARGVRDEAKIYLRHDSFQLGKAAYARSVPKKQKLKPGWRSLFPMVMMSDQDTHTP